MKGIYIYHHAKPCEKRMTLIHGILLQSNYIWLPLFHPSVPFLAAHPVVIFGSLPENNEKMNNIFLKKFI